MQIKGGEEILKRGLRKDKSGGVRREIPNISDLDILTYSFLLQFVFQVGAMTCRGIKPALCCNHVALLKHADNEPAVMSFL